MIDLWDMDLYLALAHAAAACAAGVFVGTICAKLAWKWGDDLFFIAMNFLHRKTGSTIFAFRRKR